MAVNSFNTPPWVYGNFQREALRATGFALKSLGQRPNVRPLEPLFREAFRALSFALKSPGQRPNVRPLEPLFREAVTHLQGWRQVARQAGIDRTSFAKKLFAQKQGGERPQPPHLSPSTLSAHVQKATFLSTQQIKICVETLRPAMGTAWKGPAWKGTLQGKNLAGWLGPLWLGPLWVAPLWVVPPVPPLLRGIHAVVGSAVIGVRRHLPSKRISAWAKSSKVLKVVLETVFHPILAVRKFLIWAAEHIRNLWKGIARHPVVGLTAGNVSGAGHTTPLPVGATVRRHGDTTICVTNNVTGVREPKKASQYIEKSMRRTMLKPGLLAARGVL